MIVYFLSLAGLGNMNR